MSDQVAWLRAQIEADKASAERREGPTVWFDDETIDRCNADLALLDLYAEVQHLDYEDTEPEYACGRAVGLGEAVRLLASGYRRRAGWKDQWSV